jgi:hypothetical protein
VHVRIFLLLPMMPMRAVSGRFRPMRAEFLLGLTGIGRLMRDTLFYDEECVLTMRESLPLIVEYILKHLLELQLL